MLSQWKFANSVFSNTIDDFLIIVCVTPLQYSLGAFFFLFFLNKWNKQKAGLESPCTRQEGLQRMEFNFFITISTDFLSPNQSAGIHRSRMRSFSINPVKCERQKFPLFTFNIYFIYWYFNLFKSIKKTLSSMQLNTGEDMAEKTNDKYCKSNFFLSWDTNLNSFALKLNNLYSTERN